MAHADPLTRPDGTPIRILTVDDEPSLIELLSMAMRYEGWEVHTATSGAEAVRVAREAQPDALVLDMMLPDFDGLEVMRRIRAEDPDVPVIGGKTLRLKTGLSYSFADGKPVLMLKGVTVMGVPLPNAWLGGIKNIDLIRQAGQEDGFWKTLGDGIENLQIEDGRVIISLKE